VYTRPQTSGPLRKRPRPAQPAEARDGVAIHGRQPREEERRGRINETNGACNHVRDEEKRSPDLVAR